jgi:cysteinyl-tRNA synthetase
MYQTHYRQRLDLTDESFHQTKEAGQRLADFDARIHQAPQIEADSPWAIQLVQGVQTALDDDLNAPQALAAVFESVREGNRFLDEGQPPSIAAVAAWDRVMRLFDVLPARERSLTLRVSGVEARGEPGNPQALSSTPPPEASAVEGWARAWADARLRAKTRRDYKEADRIRDLLKAAGWEVRDNKDGSVEVRRV